MSRAVEKELPDEPNNLEEKDKKNESDNFEDAKNKWPASFDVGTPKIEATEWLDEEIKITYSSTQNATNHTLKVLDKYDQIVKGELNEQECTFHFKPDLHYYGRMVTLIIRASGADNKTKDSVPREFLIGGDRAVTDLVAEKSPKYPGREIDVKWKEPKIVPQEYTLQLYELTQNESKIYYDAITVQNLSHSFIRLKSDTQFFCKVSPKYRNKTGTGSSSYPVKTDAIQRNKNYDIKTKGRPEITTCSAVLENKSDSLLSKFGWRIPDLGPEKNNYILIKTSAFREWEVNGKSEKLPVQNNVPEILAFGTYYKFSVELTYQDLDERCKIKTKDTKPLQTEIGTPKIEEAKWIDGEIKVTYGFAPGATKHTLKVLDESGESMIQNHATKHGRSFHFKPESKYYGTNSTIIVQAAAGNVKTKDSPPQLVLIGGDQAVTCVVAEKCKDCPRRKIFLKWKPPNRLPEGYTLNLYGGKENAIETPMIEKEHISHTFVELKTSMDYQFKVIPRYNGVDTPGTWSNFVQTDARKENLKENDKDFGKTSEIYDIDQGSDSQGRKVLISWNKVESGENYKASKYKLVVSHQTKHIGGIYSTKNEIYNKTIGTTKAEIPKLSMGHKYNVEVTTILTNLDTRDVKEVTKEHHFFTKPSIAVINDCVYEKGMITFSWKPVVGAEEYQLVMKDEHMKREVAKTETVKTNKCDVQVTEQLCVGKTCMTKVYALVNDMKSETDWKAHLIGGDHVPRNVKAFRNSENPQRSIKVTFDQPKDGIPSEYKIVSKPVGKKERIYYCTSNSLLIEHLIKGTKYKFYVHAKQKNGWSEGSMSNSEITEGGNDTPALVDLTCNQAPVAMQGMVIQGGAAAMIIPHGKEFGKVINPTIAMNLDNTGKKEILTLGWTVPSFGNRAPDFKVEKYKVVVRKKDSSDFAYEKTHEFEKGLDTYSITGIKLDLGEAYEISIVTIYLDIDQDKEYNSSGKNLSKITRPGKPHNLKHDVKHVNGTEGLEIRWNAAKSAKDYMVDIYTEDRKEEPLYSQKTEGATTWFHKFEDGFGYGTSFHACIRAVREEGKENSSKTVQISIGGDLSPRKVNATITHDKVINQNTQVYLSWEHPQKIPESYKILCENAKHININCESTERLVEGLRAGENYVFKVFAIHKISGTTTTSGGCLSNKILTDPRPTQVKNVYTIKGSNPSTSIKIHWDKVDAAKQDELTVYRVSIISKDKTLNLKMKNVTKENVCVFGLKSDTIYSITVAGGNSRGFGRYSEECVFETEPGKPRNVMLVNVKKSPASSSSSSSSLLLEFSDAEGEPVKHLASLYKLNKTPYITDVEMKSGESFDDLVPNTAYFVRVSAVFEKKRGESVESSSIMTAPSPPTIIEKHCCIKNGTYSSKSFLLKWIPNVGCKEHEIEIRYGIEVVESVQIVRDKNELEYHCQHEASQYTVKIRAKNQFYGPWSDNVFISLAPKKPTAVTADLEKDGKDILIKCKADTSGFLSYFCEAFCENESVGEAAKMSPVEGEETVCLNFEPKETAKKYHFKLWAKDSKGLVGESTCSVLEGESTCSVLEGESTCSVLEGESTCSVLEGESTCSVLEGESTCSVLVGESTCSVLEGESTCSGDVVSRPACGKIVSLERTKKNPSTDITITWETIERCDEYELRIENDQKKIENITRTRKTKYCYWCLCPGSKYNVIVRGICSPVLGVPSDNMSVELTPAEVELIEEDDDEPQPVEFIHLKWNELEPKPKEYHVVLCQGKVKILEKKIENAEHVFKDDLKPGLLYHCTVAGCNDAGVGKAVKTRNYRIKWNIPNTLLVTPDENTPSRCAKISWDQPDGVNCFKLNIGTQTGTVTKSKLNKNSFVFKSGMPGNTYSIQLYCGCDGRYDESRYTEAEMKMKPEPPLNLKAVPHRMNEIIVTFKENSAQPRSYHVCAKRLMKEGEEDDVPVTTTTTQERVILKNLVPGESYEVSVTALCNNQESKKATLDEYIQTFPAKLENLRSRIDEGSIIFEWDALAAKPDKYTVQWRVNNNPITEESTEETKFQIQFLKSHRSYNLRVMAVNSAGAGEMTPWETFTTDPSPPRSWFSRK